MLSDSIDGVGLDLLGFVGERRFATILADPPWQFTNKTGKIAPEHRRLSRYRTLTLEDIKALPVASVAAQRAHLYLWCPNALLPEGLAVMKAWGLQLQVQHRVAQSAQGWRLRWTGRRFLFSKRHGTHSIRRAGKECKNACARPAPSEFIGHS